jgi:hypothetical protein
MVFADAHFNLNAQPKRFFSAPGISGNWNLNPASRNRFGATRQPVSASADSVPINREPSFTAHSGAGGLHGRCSAPQFAHEVPVCLLRRMMQPGCKGKFANCDLQMFRHSKFVIRILHGLD